MFFLKINKLYRSRKETIMHLNKQKISSFLRKIHLLPIVDGLILLYCILRNKKSNQLFLKEHPNFMPPPYTLMFEAHNHTNFSIYYEMGLKHAALIKNLIKEHLDKKAITVYEWGCGPARIIQHLKNSDAFENITFHSMVQKKYTRYSF